jgi:hypothetical protein
MKSGVSTRRHATDLRRGRGKKFVLGETFGRFASTTDVRGRTVRTEGVDRFRTETDDERGLAGEEATRRRCSASSTSWLKASEIAGKSDDGSETVNTLSGVCGGDREPTAGLAPCLAWREHRAHIALAGVPGTLAGNGGSGSEGVPRRVLRRDLP